MGGVRRTRNRCRLRPATPWPNQGTQQQPRPLASTHLLRRHARRLPGLDGPELLPTVNPAAAAAAAAAAGAGRVELLLAAPRVQVLACRRGGRRAGGRGSRVSNSGGRQGRQAVAGQQNKRKGPPGAGQAARGGCQASSPQAGASSPQAKASKGQAATGARQQPFSPNTPPPRLTGGPPLLRLLRHDVDGGPRGARAAPRGHLLCRGEAAAQVELLRGGDQVVGEPGEGQPAGHVEREVACRKGGRGRRGRGSVQRGGRGRVGEAGQGDRARFRAWARQRGQAEAGEGRQAGHSSTLPPAPHRPIAPTPIAPTDHEGQELEDCVGLGLGGVGALLRADHLLADKLQAGRQAGRQATGGRAGRAGRSRGRGGDEQASVDGQQRQLSRHLRPLTRTHQSLTATEMPARPPAHPPTKPAHPPAHPQPAPTWLTTRRTGMMR